LRVRYADDAVFGFENREEAERVRKGLGPRLERFGWKLHPAKTRLLWFGRTSLEKGRESKH